MAEARRLRRRPAVPEQGLPATLHPVLRRVYAQRGLRDGRELQLDLSGLLPPDGLLGIGAASTALAAAIREGRRIVLAGDYDADGATGVALGVLGLRALGARDPGYVVPDRLTMGYGLSPALVEAALAQGAELVLTVDNGIASLAGVAHANARGLPVLISDHHLAGPELPAALAIVNPNQPGCPFASKHLAGVGVLFYLLLATRSRLREAADWFGPARPEPNLAAFLDLVALGTVADLVRLDHNNRILVQQGLLRMRAGRLRPGLAALLQVAGRDPARLSAADLGFVLGPRLNAAGRLENIRLGIDCLLGEDPAAVLAQARELDAINRSRRERQAQMSEEAEQLAGAQPDGQVGLCLFHPDWHEGVVGLVASRLKERWHRPAVAFARAQTPGLLKGSARSLAGLHLRDALAEVDAAHPGLIERFGGHAMAAGLSLPEAHLDRFAAAFDAVCRRHLRAEDLEPAVDSDGELGSAELTLDSALALEQAGPWGQGFPEPVFDGRFEVLESRRIGADGSHVKYRLRGPGGEVEAVDFGGAERQIAPGGWLRAAYGLSVNRWQGRERLDLQLRWLSADG
ncbi:MAG TPA: single-stranded-DNA-specific exonuclease RecJ [Nevskiaceae bacterium]|nr:single-stranded-DNA-specific exonuclease RecJ [Nevskiaceae bacterium]